MFTPSPVLNGLFPVARTTLALWGMGPERFISGDDDPEIDQDLAHGKVNRGICRRL